MPRVSIDGQDLPRVLRATVVITHNVPEADPPPPAQPAPHHTHPDFWKQAAGDALARNVPLLLPGHHSPPSSALGDLLKLGLAAHEGAKEAAAQSPLPASQSPLPASQSPLPASQSPLPASQSSLPASQSSLPAAQRPHDPLQTPRAEFVLLLPLDHGVDIARWALAPMGPSRFHRVTLQTLDRFGTPKHTWIMFRAYVHAYREAEYTPRPADPADGRRYVEVTLRGLLPPLTAYDGQNLVVVAPGQADQTANALPALSSFEEPLLASAQAATQSQAATGGGGGGVGGGRTDSAGAIDPAVLQSALLDVPASQPDAAADDPCKDCQLCVKTKPNPQDTNGKNSNTHQIIENFGASDAWSIEHITRGWKKTSASLKKLATKLFSTANRSDGSPDGIGLSLWRFNVGASGPADMMRDPWHHVDCFKQAKPDGLPQDDYQWDRQQGQLDFLSLANGMGVEYFLAFTNSPPYWLTVNGHSYADGGTDGKGHPLPHAGVTTNLDIHNARSSLKAVSHRPTSAVVQFAQFLADVVKHLRDKTNTADTRWFVSPVNEVNWPWNDNKQEGCRYRNDDIIAVIRELPKALKGNGLGGVQIIAPEVGHIGALLDNAGVKGDTHSHVSWYNKQFQGSGPDERYGYYIDDLLGAARNKDVAKYLNYRVAAHAYHTDTAQADLITLRRAIHAKLVNRIYWMTEYCILGNGLPIDKLPWDGSVEDLGNHIDNNGSTGTGSDKSGITAALRVATVIHHDLVDAEASAWHWWTAVIHSDDPSGLIFTYYDPQRGNNSQDIFPTKMLWALGNYSRFIRPGATRVEVSLDKTVTGTGAKTVLASAYTNNLSKSPNAPALAVVLINPTDQPVRLKNLCNDMGVKLIKCYVTSSTENLKYKASSDPIVLKARSIVTLTS